MGLMNPSLDIDGFGRTYRTHANSAPVAHRNIEGVVCGLVIHPRSLFRYDEHRLTSRRPLRHTRLSMPGKRKKKLALPLL